MDFSFSEGSLYHTEEEQYFNIHPYDNALTEYESHEMDQIKNLIENPLFFYIDTSSFSLLKKFTLSVIDDNIVLFDNDRGKLISSQELLAFNSEDQLFS